MAAEELAQHVRSSLQNTSEYLLNGTEDSDCQRWIYRIQNLYNLVLRMSDYQNDEDLLQLVRDSINVLQNVLEKHSCTLRFELDRNGKLGRPSYIISPETIRYLVKNGFTAVAISSMLGVSLRAVRRRVEEHGMGAWDFYQRPIPSNNLGSCAIMDMLRRERSRAHLRSTAAHPRGIRKKLRWNEAFIKNETP